MPDRPVMIDRLMRLLRTAPAHGDPTRDLFITGEQYGTRASTVMLLARDGSTIGEQQVTVNAPEPEQTADFEATATTTGQVAGWKYEVST